MRRVGDRQAQQSDGAQHVRRDQQQPLVGTGVDPGADDRGHCVRQPDQRRQQGRLLRVRVQHRHRDERQCQFADPVAELRNGLAHPEGVELAAGLRDGLGRVRCRREPAHVT